MRRDPITPARATPRHAGAAPRGGGDAWHAAGMDGPHRLS